MIHALNGQTCQRALQEAYRIPQQLAHKIELHNVSAAASRQRQHKQGQYDARFAFAHVELHDCAILIST